MSRGRPPKPTALKELQGNPGKRKPNQNEPKPDTGVVKPDYLTPEAEKHWDRLLPLLEPLGLLTVNDADVFASLCETIVTIAVCQDELRDKGFTYTNDKGYVGQRPEVSILKNARAELRQLSAKFGLTPSDRGRLSVQAPERSKDEKGVPAFGKLKAV